MPAFSSAADLLAALVAIPSVNPDGDPGTAATGEGAIARFLAEILTGLGAESVTFEEVEPGRPNVIAHFGSSGPSGKPHVLLAPHTDTVSVAGMTVDPFAATIRDGRLYGRGACDTKGTMAAMLWALRALGPDGIRSLPVRVSFAGLMGEESNQLGSKHFARHHAGEYDFALVGEPTGCDAVVRTKGALWAVLTATGKAAHGARPELGDSAILKMAHALSALDSGFRPTLEHPDFDDPLLGKSTFNVGIIRGGSRTNIVPASCTAQLDIRLTPAFYEAGASSLLDAFLGASAPGVTSSSPPPCPPLDTPLDHPLVRRLQAVGAAPVGAPWFCDASWLSAAGLPAAAAGPGDIAQAHTEDEWIDLAELERGVSLYRRFLEAPV
ncbi:M20 family metallopeptidase [soil metagenome]